MNPLTASKHAFRTIHASTRSRGVGATAGLVWRRFSEIEVKYEDLLGEPQRKLGELAEFCGVNADSADIASAGLEVRRDRALTFRKDPASLALTEAAQSRLAEFGY